MLACPCVCWASAENSDTKKQRLTTPHGPNRVGSVSQSQSTNADSSGDEVRAVVRLGVLYICTIHVLILSTLTSVSNIFSLMHAAYLQSSRSSSASGIRAAWHSGPGNKTSSSSSALSSLMRPLQPNPGMQLRNIKLYCQPNEHTYFHWKLSHFTMNQIRLTTFIHS